MKRLTLAAALIVGGAAILAAGCGADFTDQSPTPDLTQVAVDPPDLAGLDLTGLDLTRPAQTGGAVARGTFEGRAGHAGAGSAELYRNPDGSFELRFGGDFKVSGVPGPVVYISSRDKLGSSIDGNADVRIAALRSNAGAQVYPLAGDSGRRFAWVWCDPFRVEVARAELKAVN